MTVCLALLGDSASPGARERMYSGFPYWKRPMLSTYGIEVASDPDCPQGPYLPWAAEPCTVLRV